MTQGAVPLTISALIDTSTRHCPDGLALLAPGRPPLSYRRLRDLCDVVAQQLHTLGISRDDRVALVLPNGPEMATAFLATTCAATCAPLNPAYCAREFDFYLADLHASAVLVQRDVESPVREVARARGITVIELLPSGDAEAGTFRLEAPGKQPVTAEPARADDVALLLHTSGTTSRPKLVPLSHANLCESAANIARTLGLGPLDRCLSVMPLFHIHGLVAALLASVCSGGSVVCTPGFDATFFFAWLESFDPTWYTAVPTMHQAILAAAEERKVAPARHRLRFVRSSSSSLAPPVMRGLEAALGVPVVEAYGMTEASHQICSNPLPPAVRKPGAVGLPAGPEVAIMDEQGNLLPAGERGEVVIRGRSVTAGYENNPEANRSALVDGWFRTGDQASFDAEGYLFLSGRLKELINRGGEKISPREIDEVLLEHPAVAQAVAFAVPHATLGEDVAAAVVLRPNVAATPSEIRQLAFERLAPFKVPSQVIVVAAIPKGPTGKLQRVGLAEKLAHELTSPFVAPKDEIDGLLADLWREVLGVPAVGMLDNFFAKGGDSLRMTRLMVRVNELFDLDLPLTAVFRYPTLEQFSHEIRRATADERLETITQTIRELQAMSDQKTRRILDLEPTSARLDPIG